MLPAKVNEVGPDLQATGAPPRTALGWAWSELYQTPMVLKREIQFWKKASYHVLTSGFTVLEGSGSQVFGGEAPSTGETGSTAGFRLECAQGTELAGYKAICRIFTRLAETWGTNDPR